MSSTSITGYHGYGVSTVAQVSPPPPHNFVRSPYVILIFIQIFLVNNISAKFSGVLAAALAVFGATCRDSLPCTTRQFVIKYK